MYFAPQGADNFFVLVFTQKNGEDEEEEDEEEDDQLPAAFPLKPISQRTLSPCRHNSDA